MISTVWEIAVEKTGGYVVSRLVLAALGHSSPACSSGCSAFRSGCLAIWTGVVSQFIPLGTYLAIAVPAVIALSRQPIDALWVVVFGVVYQQVENYLFSPRVTRAPSPSTPPWRSARSSWVLRCSARWGRSSPSR